MFSASDSWALRTGPSRGLPVYLILFILAQLFSVYLIVDAIFNQNTIQLIGFLFFNLCCFIYGILQISQIRIALGIYVNATNGAPDSDQGVVLQIFAMLQAYVIGMIIVIALCEAVYVWLAFKLYKEFGWKVYKKIGADLQKKSSQFASSFVVDYCLDMYRSYHIFLMLLKLDFFFFLGFAIQLILLVIQQGDIEMGLTIAAVPVIFFILIAAVYAVRYENKGIMLAFIFGLALAVAYFVYKLSKIFSDPLAGTRYSPYFGVSIYISVFAIFSLLMTLATMAYSVICYLNFDRGLKPFHLAQKSGRIGTDEAINQQGRVVLDEEDDLPGNSPLSVPPDYPYAVEENKVETYAASDITSPSSITKLPKPLPLPPTKKKQPVFDPSNPMGITSEFTPATQPVYDITLLDAEREKQAREEELKRYWPARHAAGGGIEAQQLQQQVPPIPAGMKVSEGVVHF